MAAQGLPIIKKNIFQHLLKHNGRLKAVGKLLAFYQKSGIQKLVRTTGLLKVLPGDLDKIERILPTITGESFREKVSFKPLKNDKLKVAYFTGCVTNYVNPQVGYSLLKVLEANNVGVLIPEQYCCGVPAWASGETQVVRFLAEANVKQFMDLDVDYIVTDCATCLSTWLKYPEILNNGNIQKLSAKVIDINRFLIEILDIKLEPADLGIKVTYHDPCHLKRLPLGKEAPRELLNRLSPSFERVEMALADSCCGSAGSFNLTHYNLSQKVVAPKVEAIEKSGAQVVTSSCPSCIMQLNHALRERGSNIEVKHTIELAAQCLQKKN
ncbi:MAG: (Fe-S)-binding protein [Clostridia bacterium]|nr:(Fe-S)-binding protein [Clostridia bacterium]